MLNQLSKCPKESEQYTYLIYKIYEFVSDLSSYYPYFNNWYYEKVIPGLYDQTREILFIKESDNIIGIAILKNTINEKKISTLRVHSDHQHLGIGKLLLEESFRILNECKPTITVSEERLPQFKKLFLKFDFTLSEVKQDIYYKGKKEYIFNSNKI